MPTRVNPSNWASGEKLNRYDINQLQENLTYCADIEAPINIVSGNSFILESDGEIHFDSTSKLIINDQLRIYYFSDNIAFDGYFIGKTLPINENEITVDISAGGTIDLSQTGANTIVLTGVLQADAYVEFFVSYLSQNVKCNFESNGFTCYIQPTGFTGNPVVIYPGQFFKVVFNTKSAAGSDYYMQPLAKINNKGSESLKEWCLISESNLDYGVSDVSTYTTVGGQELWAEFWDTTGKAPIKLSTPTLGSRVVGKEYPTYYDNGIIFTNNMMGDRYEFTLTAYLTPLVPYTQVKCYPYFDYLSSITEVGYLADSEGTVNYQVTSIGQIVGGGWNSGGQMPWSCIIQDTARPYTTNPLTVYGWYKSDQIHSILRFGLMVDWTISSSSTIFPVRLSAPFTFSIKQYRQLLQ